MKVKILQFLTTFTQLNARPKFFLQGWLLALSIKEGPIKCAVVCNKSCVILSDLNQEWIWAGLFEFGFCADQPGEATLLKVRQSQKQIMVSQKWTRLTILSREDAQDSKFRSFFGRIEEIIICFRDLVTFRKKPVFPGTQCA